MEKERQQIEEDKAQVDRYKQLLLKQRDIMIALTARLNERDETIIQLQEELDAYDRIHRESEERLDRRIARVQLLETCLSDAGIQPPPDDDDEKLNDPQSEALRRRYPPYADEGEPQNDTPLSLLTAEEKIEELMDIIERQKSSMMQNKPMVQMGRPEQLKMKEQEIAEQQAMIDDAQNHIKQLQNEKNSLESDKEKILQQLESQMLGKE